MFPRSRRRAKPGDRTILPCLNCCSPVVGQNIGRHAGRGSPVKRACVAMSLVLALLGTLCAALKARTDLVLENLALRQQLALLSGRSKRHRVGLLDRVFWMWLRSEEHTSELQSQSNIVCRLLLEKK